MAKKKAPRKRPRRAAATASAVAAQPSPYSSLFGDLQPGYLVLFREDHVPNRNELIHQMSGIPMAAIASSSDFEGHAIDTGSPAQAMFLEDLGVAVMDLDPDQAQYMNSQFASDGDVMMIEPEPIFVAAGVDPESAAYLSGYRDAVNHLCNELLSDQPSKIGLAEAVAQFADDDQSTWGLKATGVLDSPFTGKDVRVAVLDTGFDLDHPDFVGRTIESRSFIGGELVQDDNRHGTHCAGTACGPRQPGTARRYGVAPDSELFIGKVLSNRGFALGRSVLAGIEWAISQQCEVISLSLSARVNVGENFSQLQETVGSRAVRRNSLPIAAAGNDSRRGSGSVVPVGSPANCPSFLAIAAVDNRMRIADFSNAGINQDGGQIDLAGPGVSVFSSAPEPAPPRQPPFFRRWSARHDTIDGTSMATPHVAGIAALWKEKVPTATAAELSRLLTANAKRLSLPAQDVGNGLVQAPTS